MRTTKTDRVLMILGELDRRLVEVQTPAFRNVGIGREHWQVLRVLRDGKGHAMGEISERVGLAGATATRVVDFLAQRSLVYRRSDPLDRRRVLIFLAEPGREVLEQVDEALLVHFAPFVASFETEREDLVQLLEQLVAKTPTRSGDS